MTKNREIKNALLRTVVKLYEGMYPSHDIKLSKKSKKVLGSRFLSVERDNDSEIEPLVRKNLEDFYRSANGVDVIDFSQSPIFFPSKIEQFYSLEEITEIARKSPCVTLDAFSEYINTRPDKERFPQNYRGGIRWDEYEEKGGYITFLGLDKLENLKKELLEEAESIVQDCIEKDYCYRYSRELVSNFIEPYLSEERGYDPSLYEGIKGMNRGRGQGGDFKNFGNFFTIHNSKFGPIQKRLRTYASPERFEAFCKKFNIKIASDIESEIRGGEKLPYITIQKIKEYREKYGITGPGTLKQVYSSDLLQKLFPKRTKIDLRIALEMQKDLNSGMFLKDVEAKYGWHYYTIETKLKEYKLPYMIGGKWKNKD
jgi:hypothetical protein